MLLKVRGRLGLYGEEGHCNGPAFRTGCRFEWANEMTLLKREVGRGVVDARRAGTGSGKRAKAREHVLTVRQFTGRGSRKTIGSIPMV